MHNVQYLFVCRNHKSKPALFECIYNSIVQYVFRVVGIKNNFFQIRHQHFYNRFSFECIYRTVIVQYVFSVIEKKNFLLQHRYNRLTFHNVCLEFWNKPLSFRFSIIINITVLLSAHLDFIYRSVIVKYVFRVVGVKKTLSF